ncbi:LysR family transcriptional regulator [Pseudomonas azotoformans]|uniref:LysR family transcriptional regulator n=1 Tax=Pseudomonas azotoformans TaxID=47878 RepID=A0A1V2JA62_PSEAZ|nr:LysR family transcriptional regulator [Pseudomonas azotoformans]OIN50676.1 LysR family transcriptional regulator [Pseudomonas azotoformans]ONH42159.1 LysR family transcriptional regulator [Pseudomonas azotoformans]SDN37909.1 DNA-binding transcriptional regulator, LysR family [Pseudomonas azotoformans]
MISKGKGDFESPVSDNRMPSLLALRCFESAGRFESFARAAEELHLTPGAISRAVRLLEEDLGVDLFDRRSRRVFLTNTGRRLAKAVNEGLGVMNHAVREIRTESRRARQLVLSCEPTLLMRWLIPRWSEFQARHCGLDIHLVAGGGLFSFDQGIDLAIRRDDFPRPPGYHAEALFPEKVGPVCRPDKVDTWFGPNGHFLHSTAPLLHTKSRPTAWQEWAVAKQLPTPVTEMQAFEHFYFSIQAAVAGLGVAMGPWHLVRDDILNGVLAAPLGFVEDGTSYCLLSSTAPKAGGVEMELLQWLRAMGR